MGKMPDRRKLRKEYLHGGISYRGLAKKYNISESTVKRWAREDGWSEARTETETKINTQMPDAVAAEQLAVKIGVFEVAEKLLKKLDESLEAQQGLMEPGEIKQYASALRDIKEIRGDRDKLTEKEKRAKISKLQQETKAIKSKQTEKDSNTVTVEMQGETESYGG